MPWTQQSFWTHVSRFDTVVTSHRVRADELRPPFRMEDSSLKWSTVRHHGIVFLSLMWIRAEEGAHVIPDELLYRSCESYLDAITDYRQICDNDDAQKLMADFSAEVRVVLKMKFVGMGLSPATRRSARS